MHRSGRAREVVFGGQALDEQGEVGAGELPLEGLGRLLVAALEGEQAPEAAPRCELPLSTTQNTRLAEAYGSLPITWATRRLNGAMPVVGAQRPNSLAWCTSQAAK